MHSTAKMMMALVLAGSLCAGCAKKDQQQQTAAPQATPPPATATTEAPTAETAPAPAAPETQPATTTPAPEAKEKAATVTPGTASGANDAAVAPKPAAVAVVVPAGTRLSVRLDNAISTKTAQAGEQFSGSLTRAVSNANGDTVSLPRGAKVSGEVVSSAEAGRIKGAGVLSLRLTSLTVNGKNYPIASSTFSQVAKGRGKRTAIASGGGAALGGIIGGLAGGGKGAAIGILGGGAAGAAGGAYTGARDVDLPAETVVSFRLSRALRLR